MPTEPFPPLGVPEHNGRYRYQYEVGPDTGGHGRHVWSVHPAVYPAVDTYMDEWGNPRTIYYDPAIIQPRKGQFRHEYDQPVNNRLEELHPPEGLLWRGMSDEEYQAAKQNGYFESNGSYNFNDQQGLTFFSTDPTQGESYANGFAPSQHKAAFDKPAHVVGIPMRPWDYEHETEKGIRGRIPFSDVTHHYVGNVYAILPGEHRVYEDYMGPVSQGGGIGGVRVQWSEDHPVSPEAQRVAQFFFAYTPTTYTYQGPKVRPPAPRPEGWVDTSDYSFTGSPETQYHHRNITPETLKGIEKRTTSIDDYYDEMRQRRDSGLEPIPWNEWLARVAYIRNAMAWTDWADKIKYVPDPESDKYGRYILPQAGAFLDYRRGEQDGKPVVYIDGIYTHPENRNDGVAEAMMRRLVEDHSGFLVHPGYMTQDGQAFHDRMLEREPEARELVTAASLLVGPEDAYDEWDWIRRHEEHPVNSVHTDAETWYHVSAHRIPEGTTLAPMRGETPWNDSPYNHGLENRANWIWVEYDKNKARGWMRYILEHQPEAFLYRVQPDVGPFAWNGTADEGWVTNRALVVEYLDQASRDLSFQEKP